MERTVRQKRSIIIYFSFYISLTFVLVYFTMQVIYPSFRDISVVKNETEELYTATQKLKKVGMSFNDFIVTSKKIPQGSYTKEVLSNIEADFFNEHFQNTEYNNFASFIAEKEKGLNTDESQEEKEEKLAKISSLLPVYSGDFVDGDNSSLTDFQFINYVESLLATFSLTHSNEIGIKKVELLEEFEGIGGDSSLANNIFYIPLELNLVGSKGNILQFLHYVENVAKISISGDDFQVYNDNILTKNGRKVLLKGSKYSSDYNIYENQIIDIEEISMSDYIDTSYEVREENQNLSEFVKETQSNERFNIDVTLRFYIKGVQYYKIEETIKRFINTHALTKNLMTKGLKDMNLDPVIAINIKKANGYLKEIESEMVHLKKSFVKKENIEAIYKKVTVYDTIFYNLYTQTGIDMAINSVQSKYTINMKNLTTLLEDENTIGQKRDTTQKKKNYLETLETRIKNLSRKTDEEKATYNERITTRSVYDEVMYLNYLLDNNK